MSDSAYDRAIVVKASSILKHYDKLRQDNKSLTAKVERLENPWISVDERLPETKGIQYLVRMKNRANKSEFWLGQWHYLPMTNATHWMPIPPLPELNEED